MLDTIADDCDDVLASLLAVAVKPPWVIASPLSLHEEKITRVWFRQWSEINLHTSVKTAPQYHTGLTGVLGDATTRL